MKSNLLLCPVDDLDAAAAFYREALALTLKFRDGQRWCAFDAGGYTLGLAAREERLVEVPSPAFRVEDLDAAVRALLAAGARLLRPAETGPHERRAVLGVPGGGTLVLFGTAGVTCAPSQNRAAIKKGRSLWERPERSHRCGIWRRHPEARLGESVLQWVY